MCDLTGELRLAIAIRTGDVSRVLDLVRAGTGVGMQQAEAVRHLVGGDRPGVARVLAGEGVVDVGGLRLDRRTMDTTHAGKELLCCGAEPPEPETPAERALAAALRDARAGLAAASVMMRAADERPGLYRLMCSVAEMGPSGEELLLQCVRLGEQGGTAGTPATPA